jgi:hypothetical protein
MSRRQVLCSRESDLVDFLRDGLLDARTFESGRVMDADGYPAPALNRLGQAGAIYDHPLPPLTLLAESDSAISA